MGDRYIGMPFSGSRGSEPCPWGLIGWLAQGTAHLAGTEGQLVGPAALAAHEAALVLRERHVAAAPATGCDIIPPYPSLVAGQVFTISMWSTMP